MKRLTTDLKTAIFSLLILIAMASIGCAGSGPTRSPSVIVMGDSISIGYTPYLAPKAVHTPGNAQTAAHTLANAETWLEGQYDTIIFNNGMWDANFDIDAHAGEYRSNLSQIAQIVKRHTEHPVFILTTRSLAGAVHNASIDRLNMIASEVMAQNGIEVINLNDVSASLTAEYIDPVHMTEDGYRALAQAINTSL